MKMILDTAWKASNKDGGAPEDRDLLALAGLWGSGVQVKVSNPASFSSGPVTVSVFPIEDLGSDMPDQGGDGQG